MATSIPESCHRNSEPFGSGTGTLQKKTGSIQKKTESIGFLTRPIQKKTGSIQSLTRPIQKKTGSIQSLSRAIQKKTESIQSLTRSIQSKTESFGSGTRCVGTTILLYNSCAVQRIRCIVRAVLQNAVGKPVTGEDFFDRKEEVATLWSRLATDDVLLLAPRRVGKTSLMYHLRDTAEQHGYRAIYVSVADATTEIAFIRKLLGEIEKHSEKKRVSAALRKSRVGRFFRRISGISLAGFGLELRDDAEHHWQAIGESIATALHSLGGRWLLLIDELPIFVLALLKKSDGHDRAKAFLNWFRDLRQNSETSRSVRWLLAGSIGLDTVTRRMALGDTINDLYVFTDFGAFDDGTARAFLSQLADSYDVPLVEEVRDEICRRTGWLIPFHLQLWFAELRTRCEGRQPAIEDVEAVYERLLSAGKKTYFDYWHQRLRDELGKPDDGHAVALLNAACADREGVTEQTLAGVLAARIRDEDERDERLKFLLDVLMSDGYLVRDRGRIRFMSSLLAEFWRRHIA